MGDVAQALPIVGVLHDAGVRVGWAVEDRFAGIVEHARWPVEPLVWKRGVPGLMNLRGRGRDFEAVLDVQGNMKSGTVAVSLGAGTVIGLARENVREFGNLMFTAVRAAPARGPHVLERSLAVVEQCLGRRVAPDDIPEPPWLEARPHAVERVRGQLAAVGVDIQRPGIAAVVGVPDDPRAWPVTLAAKLVQEHAGFLIAGPAEAGLSLPADVPVLRQGADTELLIALGRLLAEHGWRVAGHDSGAMHVLHACAVRGVVLFGPQDPARTGPWRGRTLVAPGELACRPCLDRVCREASGPVCMSRIDPEQVARSL
ncbi:MAG: hypothetical protein CMJ85_11180 [Planctomycetes bacterium]|nr:hypothetical protein [Planctomycetota bacterium]MDP6423219.1 glycosyltransferase family 9 protein [Planctomycetota bacterium]